MSITGRGSCLAFLDEADLVGDLLALMLMLLEAAEATAVSKSMFLLSLLLILLLIVIAIRRKELRLDFLFQPSSDFMSNAGGEVN